MAAQDHSQSSFLWIDREAARQQAVRRGEIVSRQVKSLSVPDGMIQHWIGGVLSPDAALARLERGSGLRSYAKVYGLGWFLPRSLPCLCRNMQIKRDKRDKPDKCLGAPWVPLYVPSMPCRNVRSKRTKRIKPPPQSRGGHFTRAPQSPRENLAKPLISFKALNSTYLFEYLRCSLERFHACSILSPRLLG